MTTGLLNPTHIAIVLLVALLVLGPKRLPQTGRSLGRAMREFKDGITGHDDHSDQPPAPSAAVTAAAPPAIVPAPPAEGQPAAAPAPAPTVHAEAAAATPGPAPIGSQPR